MRYESRLRHVGCEGEPGPDCYTWHWDANQSISLFAVQASTCAARRRARIYLWHAALGRQSINLFDLQATTREPPRVARTWLWHLTLGRQSIYLFFCTGVDTWGAKASQELIVNQSIFFAVQAQTHGVRWRARNLFWHGIRTQINQSFC